MEIAPRFEIDLDVEGALKPGHPIHLTVRGQANFATRDATIQLILPEVAAAERSSWDVVEMPVGEEITAHAELRKSFAAGERFRERTTITIPEPGYYNVLAIALQHSDDQATDGGTLVGRGASRGVWLWIDEHGGRVTTEFDPSIFPAGIRPVRGPRGSDRQPPRLRHGGSRHITCTIIPGDILVVMSACPGTSGGEVEIPPTGPSATAAVNVTYVDKGTNVTRPLAYARLSWNVVNTLTSAAVATGGAYTNANGDGPVIDCKGPMTERRLELTVHTDNSKVELKNYLTSNSNRTTVGQFYAACGGRVDIRANDEQAHLFTNLNKNWDAHTRVFGIAPPTIIRAGLYPISTRGTRYDWGAVDVHVEPRFDNIFTEFGVFTSAHEWAHLWQDQYLYEYPAPNGLKRFYGCGDEHIVSQETNFGCALAEAFADWYAVLIRESDVPNWRRDLEENTAHLLKCVNNCTTDGSVVQGAVSAFLWDITDPAFVENFDRIQKRPMDMIYSIKGCTVSVNRLDYFPYTGIDHLIWCMENRYPYEVRVQTASGDQLMTFFNKRSRSAWPMAARGPMLDAFSDDFRRLWLVDLYSKLSVIGQTPIFRILDPSEDPTLQQPSTEPADTNCTQTGIGITCPAV